MHTCNGTPCIQSLWVSPNKVEDGAWGGHASYKNEYTLQVITWSTVEN